MRVLYICGQSLAVDGAARSHVVGIIDGLKRRGVVVQLHAPTHAYRGGLSRLITLLGIQIAAIRDLAHADIVYMRSHPVLAPFAIACLALRCRLVVEVNGAMGEVASTYSWSRRWRRLLDFLHSWPIRRASLVIAVTNELQESLQELTQAPIRVVPNAADAETFKPSEHRLTDQKDSETYVSFFGEFSEWQGIDVMLMAASLDTWPDGVNLVFIGEGAHGKQVDAFARTHGHVIRKGRLDQEELAEIVAKGLAGLGPMRMSLPRLGVGFSPVKMYETLACGIPIVLADLPGQADFVRRHQCGLVVPPDDPYRLGDAVRQLRDDRGLADQLGKNGRAAVIHGHTWDHRAGATLELLSQL